ncbi:MAG TPA: hypothetical protein HA254_01885 [Candidatus Diapherotrites archaeon]|uniref:HEPN domain-containing protein n=1 Tax=Candidatus Iainarchaeum sp. TaxID=3101447 RepID=A0A7J4J003_9ARCH|nr:hypothetical protein [Candidatus Diapherotrites archaeon]
MEGYKEHLDLASERFQVATEQYGQERYHTAAHLFINSAINYHNAICQKFLKKIPSHKAHSGTSYFHELEPYMMGDCQKYRDSYALLVSYKGVSDYGYGLSIDAARIIKRHAAKIKEIAQGLL